MLKVDAIQRGIYRIENDFGHVNAKVSFLIFYK